MTYHVPPFGWATLDDRNEVFQVHVHLCQCCGLLWINSVALLGVFKMGEGTGVVFCPGFRLQLQRVFWHRMTVGYVGVF